MLALCRSLNGFPRERATVLREMARVRGGYRAGPYFFSKLLVGAVQVDPRLTPG